MGGSPAKESRLSMWLNSYNPWPRYRLAGVICLIEFRFFQLMGQRDARLEELLAVAQKHHALIMRESDLQPLLLAYRTAIYRRLWKDRKRSPAWERLFQEYKKAMPQEVLDAVYGYF